MPQRRAIIIFINMHSPFLSLDACEALTNDYTLAVAKKLCQVCHWYGLQGWITVSICTKDFFLLQFYFPKTWLKIVPVFPVCTKTGLDQRGVRPSYFSRKTIRLPYQYPITLTLSFDMCFTPPFPWVLDPALQNTSNLLRSRTFAPKPGDKFNLQLCSAPEILANYILTFTSGEYFKEVFCEPERIDIAICYTSILFSQS